MSEVEASGPRLTVRGIASRIVAPDAARISLAVSAERSAREEAARDAGAAAQQLASTLSEMGGEVRTIDNRRHALTWLMPRVSTAELFDWDKNGNRRGRGFGASTHVTVWVRDLDLLDRLINLLTTGKAVNVHYVHWLVDDDNPAWAEVRADAIAAAIAQARQYAAALDADLRSLDEIADVGLLGSGHQEYRMGEEQARPVAAFARDEAVSLDPEPQQISATIEARFRATPVTLR